MFLRASRVIVLPPFVFALAESCGVRVFRSASTFRMLLMFPCLLLRVIFLFLLQLPRLHV